MAQMEMVRQLATHEDELGDNCIGVRERIRHIIATRQKTIDILREKAAIADKIHRGCSQSNRNANITGAFGGTMAMLAGGITFATGGLAAPVMIAGLGGTGALCSLGGGAWSIWNEYERGQRGSDIQQELMHQLKEDEEARSQINDILNSIKKGDFGEPDRVFRQLHTFVAGLGGIGMVFGSTAAIDVLRLALPPLAFFIAGGTNTVLLSMLQYLPLIAGKGALEGMDEVAEQSASSAVKFMYDGFSKDFVRREALKAAQKAYNKAFEEAMEKAAEEISKKAAKEVGSSAAQKATEEAAKKAAKKAAKEAAKATAKKTATKAAQKAASKVAKEQAKIAAKMTGAITVGFNALSLLWEGYNAYHNHYASQQESQLGRELRCLAENLEERLRNVRVK